MMVYGGLIPNSTNLVPELEPRPQRFKGGTPHHVTSAHQFLENSGTIFTAGFDGAVQVWRLENAVRNALSRTKLDAFQVGMTLNKGTGHRT